MGRSKKWLSLLMAILMMASAFPVSVSAAEESAMPTDADVDMGSVSEITDAPPTLVNEITPEPEVTPEPTAEPTATPEPTAEPTATPEPTAEPTVTPEPTAEPTTTPEQTQEPDPTETPEPTEDPEATAEPEPTDEPSDEPSDEPEVDGDPEGPYKVTFYNGTEVLAEAEVMLNEMPEASVVPTTAGGKKINAWMYDGGTQVDPLKTPITQDTDYYAWFMPGLKTTHDRYINGTGNGMFSPLTALKRGQAAVLLYNLLTDKARGPYACSFSDVSSSAYYAEAVATLASYGVINGYTDGTFRPNKSVSRAEFVKMIVTLTGATGGSASFSDVSSTYWGRDCIAAAAGNGWINGYTDGTFRPGNEIKRCEAVTVLNRVLGRSADQSQLQNSDVLHFLDVPTNAWYYAAIMEACIGHTHTYVDGVERWTSYNVESSGLSAGIHTINGVYTYINSSGQPVAMKAGINLIDGKYYYAPSAGYTFTADLSSKDGCIVFADGTADQALADGFNLIGTSLFYWVAADKAPQLLDYGLNVVAGKTYWADAEGYIIRNDFERGVVELGGDHYLSDGYCAIITSGYTFASDASKMATVDLKNKTFEFDGSMYYVKSNYTIAIDEWVEYLYFGTNGAYTSGDSVVDRYVYAIVKDILANNSLTRVQQLLKVYYHFRGGSGTTWKASGYTYQVATNVYTAGRYKKQQNYSWIIAEAKDFLVTKNARCYGWAAGYLMCARRLGFQGYLCVGFLEPSYHCWALIKWSGAWHISDVEIEYGYMAFVYTGTSQYRNLFEQTLSKEGVSTYKNTECGYTYTFHNNVL